MSVKLYYAQARKAGYKATAAIDAARRFIAGRLAEFHVKLAAWEAEPDKRRYAPGGIANRPKMPIMVLDRGNNLPFRLRELDVASWLRHDGWYTDDQQDNMFSPRVWRLPHGRFLAGYVATNWDSATLDGVHESESDAWAAADELARVDAEREREYHEKWRAARAVEDAREDKRSALREARIAAIDLVNVLRDLPAHAPGRTTVCRMLNAQRERMAEALRGIASDTDVLADFAADGVEP